jgi:hypothetical protein
LAVIDDQPRRPQSPQRDEKEEFRALVFCVPFVVKNFCSGIQINHEGHKDHKVMEYEKSAPWCSSCPLR